MAARVLQGDQRCDVEAVRIGQRTAGVACADQHGSYYAPSRQAFSTPSKQTFGLQPKGDLNSIAFISASSTISTPWSKPSASKPPDSTLQREKNPRYRHDNGLNQHRKKESLRSAA